MSVELTTGLMVLSGSVAFLLKAMLNKIEAQSKEIIRLTQYSSKLEVLNTFREAEVDKANSLYNRTKKLFDELYLTSDKSSTMLKQILNSDFLTYEQIESIERFYLGDRMKEIIRNSLETGNVENLSDTDPRNTVNTKTGVPIDIHLYNRISKETSDQALSILGFKN